MAGPRPFTVGGVLRRTFAVLGRDLPAFVGLALALSLLPQLAGIALPYALPDSGFAGLAAGGLLGLVVASSVYHRGAALALALPVQDGGRRSLGSASKAGAVLFISNAGILILVWLGVGLASVLLLVPGAMLLCRWIVALPAEVAERVGVGGALARSRALAEGHRWRIFGLLAIYAVPAGIGPFLLLFQNPNGPPEARTAAAVVHVVISTAVAVVGTVGLAAIYAELRAAREGATPAEIAESFG